MKNKIFTVAILGVGARGGDTYGNIINQDKDYYKIVSLCDLKKDRLERFGKEFNVNNEACFLDEIDFFKKKRADLIIIATQDAQHVKHMLKAFELGYDILVEKPISDNIKDCESLLEAQKKYGGKVLVCHVLRYAPAFVKVGELIENKVIGDLVCIDALERVAYWHQAHSYVRGNWRNDNFSSPMILAKCCHDLDLLQYYANSKCETISSIGELFYFNKEHMPKGASNRCTECINIESCPYSAKRIYVDRWKQNDSPKDGWPFNVITSAPVTEEKLNFAIKNGSYGKCVFDCDNNVVDHQITSMTFSNKVKASLTMTAFTAESGRRIDFHGTLGEIILDEEKKIISIHKYGEKEEIISITNLDKSGYGHGGGDNGLINKLYDVLNGTTENKTSLESSIESHLMGIYAEKSRLQKGKLMIIHEKINKTL